jgi:hypothetical protein
MIITFAALIAVNVALIVVNIRITRVGVAALRDMRRLNVMLMAVCINAYANPTTRRAIARMHVANYIMREIAEKDQ